MYDRHSASVSEPFPAQLEASYISSKPRCSASVLLSFFSGNVKYIDMELYTVRISGLWRYYIYIAEILKASSHHLTHVPSLSSTKVASKARNICFSTHHFTFRAALFPKDFVFNLYCAKSECHLVSLSPPSSGQLNFFLHSRRFAIKMFFST